MPSHSRDRALVSAPAARRTKSERGAVGSFSPARARFANTGAVDGGEADRGIARASEREPTRRSIVLHAAVWFANFYLIVFAIDAVVSVVDRVSGFVPLGDFAATHPAQYAVRLGLATVLIAASAVMPFVLLFLPQLPKLPFAELIACFAVGSARAALQHAGPDPAGPWMDIAEVAAVAVAFLAIERRTGMWLLRAARLPRKRRLVARTVVAALVTAVVVPLALTAMVVAAFVVAVERQTGGYLDVTPAGIELRESVMVKDGRTVHLIAMLHFGEHDFYGALADGMPPGSLVLAEGITDRDRRLRGFPSTSRIASALGLTQQPSARTLAPGAVTRPLDPGPVPGPSQAPAAGSRSELVDADIDAAELSDDAVALLHDLGQLYASRSIGEAWRWWREELRGGRTVKVFETELIDKRNARVLARFDDAAPSYTNVVIPWGAMHMPALQAALEQRGYRLETQRRHTAVRFAAIADRLLGRRAPDDPDRSPSATAAGGT